MPIAALLPLVVFAVAWIAFCFWDLSRGPVSHLPRWLWGLIIVLSVPLGGVAYLIWGRAGR